MIKILCYNAFKKNYVTHNLCDDFQFQNIKKIHTNKTTKKTRFIINI